MRECFLKATSTPKLVIRYSRKDPLPPPSPPPGPSEEIGASHDQKTLELRDSLDLGTATYGWLAYKVKSQVCTNSNSHDQKITLGISTLFIFNPSDRLYQGE